MVGRQTDSRSSERTESQAVDTWVFPRDGALFCNLNTSIACVGAIRCGCRNRLRLIKRWRASFPNRDGWASRGSWDQLQIWKDKSTSVMVLCRYKCVQGICSKEININSSLYILSYNYKITKAALATLSLTVMETM